MSGEVTQKDVQALEKKITNLESLLGQFGKLQQRIDVTQTEMLKNHKKRFDIHSKRIELLEKAAKSKR